MDKTKKENQQKPKTNGPEITIHEENPSKKIVDKLLGIPEKDYTVKKGREGE